MSTTQRNSKILALALAFVMLLTFLPAVSFDARAVGAPTPGDYWTDSPTYYSTAWYTGGSPYTLASAADLAGLAYLVNNGNAFAGDTIYLKGDVNLEDHFWYPIGGVSPISSGVPTGNFFAGTFDGSNSIISGLYIEYINRVSNDSGYGLFGYVDKGGVIQNFTIASGEVNLGNNNVSAVGAAVGYTSGDITNVHNAIDVTMTNTSASMLGGVAGTVESKNSTVVTVSLSSNTGNLTGRGRIGGIVGAAYTPANNPGGIIIDQCYNRGADGIVAAALGNTIITVGTDRRSYAGGIVGYNQGYVTNSYAIVQLATYGGHYQGGIAGIVQGESRGAPGAISNSYSKATFLDHTNNPNYADPDPDYDKYLFGSIDDSNRDPIDYSLWVNTFVTGPTQIDCDQIIATGSNGWGAWVRTGYLGLPVIHRRVRQMLLRFRVASPRTRPFGTH
jgi:hypothetical protein